MLASSTCTLVRWPSWDSLAPCVPLRLAGRRQRGRRLLPVWCLCPCALSHPQLRMQPVSSPATLIPPAGHYRAMWLHCKALTAPFCSALSRFSPK